MFNHEIAQELLRYRGETVLKKQIEKSIRKIRESGSYTDDSVKKSGLQKIIKSFSGISTTIVVERDDEYAYDFAVIPPSLIERNVLLHRTAEEDKKIFERWQEMVKKIKELELNIDLSRFKISGPLSELNIPLFIGYRALTFDSRLSIEETTAIILHELGHVFYYLLFMINGVKTNVVLQSLNSKNFFDSEKELKIKLLNEVEKDLDVNLGDKDSVANLKTEAVIPVIVNNIGKEYRKEIPTGLYDFRTFEFLADQFVVVNGAGRALATGLHKFNMLNPKFANNEKDLIIKNIVKILKTIRISSIFVLGTTLIFGITTSLMLFMGGIMLRLIMANLFSQKSKYDPPKIRLAKIKEQLIASLRTEKLKSEQVNIILKDIEIIDNAMKEYIETVSVTKFLSEIFIPWVKDNKQIVQLQLDYEKLVNNPLYRQSAILRHSI